MVKKTGPTDVNVRKLISELRKQKKPIWKRVAKDLERPRRIRRAVNLSRINRYSKDGDNIVVPGKVLSAGDLTKKITIGALSFSKTALDKIKKSGSKALSLNEMIKEKKVKLIG